MKKIAIVAALVLFAACAKKEDAAPAADAAATDRTKADTAAKADTTKH